MKKPNLDLFHGTVVGLVQKDQPDLSLRQLAVFTTVYLEDGPHTVRGLSAKLNVPKPSITRALDRLGDFALVRRQIDPMDRRSVLVQRTPQGVEFLADLAALLAREAR